MIEKNFKGTIIIGDPCMMVKSEEDWYLGKYGESFDKLGFKNYLWIQFEEVCPIIKDSNGKKLGSFCTDSALIVVTLLDELLKYYPQFDEHIKYPNNWTIVKNFDGVVKAFEKDDCFFIEGEGNINFVTTYPED